jgi:hypothetical protein
MSSMSKPILSLSSVELKKWLIYIPETGIFYWKKEPKEFGIQLKGKRAGSVAPDGYLKIQLNKKSYTASRLAWLYVHGRNSNLLIDHINHNKNDNRISNLREVSYQDNARNKKYYGNKSGFQGIEFENNRKMYRVRIKINNQLLHLGRFDTLDEAISMRLTAENHYNFHFNHGINLDS